MLALFGVTITRSWAEEEGEPLTSYGPARRELGQVLSRVDLSRVRRSEILRAVGFDKTPVRAIMVLRWEAVALSTSGALHETVQEMHAHSCDRYPRLDPDWTNVYGTLYMTTVFGHLPELERGNPTLPEIAEPVVCGDPERPISALIDHLQREQQEIALVHAYG